MGELFMWIVPLLLILWMMWALMRDNERKRRRTTAEYERDLAAARESMLRAGLLELDRFLGNSNEKRAAVAYLKDEEQGMTKTGGKADDADRTVSEGVR